VSRKNKNLRAFLHQNPEPTIEQAWDSAWHGAQKTFHARSMQEMRGQVDRLREALRKITRPHGVTAHHFDHARALLAELDNPEKQQ